MVIWFKWYEPLSNSTADLEASERAMQFTVGWFIQPLLKGEYPQVMKEILPSHLPDFMSEESMCFRGPVDFIGLNTIIATMPPIAPMMINIFPTLDIGRTLTLHELVIYIYLSTYILLVINYPSS